MPIDRNHAFGGDQCYKRPRSRWAWLQWPWSPQARAHAAWKQFLQYATLRKGCLLGANAWCFNGLNDPARIELGEQVVCRGVLRIELFGSGRILVNARAYIGDDTLLSCSSGIEIGASALLAHGVQIFDNDSHPLDPEARVRHYRGEPGSADAIPSAPVRIGERAWVGFNAIILKGVTVGAESIVGAGSVVTKDVPPGTIVAGNPAKVIKSIQSVAAET